MPNEQQYRQKKAMKTGFTMVTKSLAKTAVTLALLRRTANELGVFGMKLTTRRNAIRGMNMKDRIKFNDAMLAAVMDGRKTQTRRPIEPQPKVTEEELRNLGAWQEGYTLSEQVCAAWRHGFVDVDCPYGEIDDVINIADKDGNIKGEIEITDVWVQQVQEISQEDAHSEGFELTGWRPTYSDPDSGGETFTPYDKFADAWIDVYSEDSWMNNEWVWVIEFKNVN